jgi:hypothetical protein
MQEKIFAFLEKLFQRSVIGSFFSIWMAPVR